VSPGHRSASPYPSVPRARQPRRRPC
jgi:hypothetical protein